MLMDPEKLLDATRRHKAAGQEPLRRKRAVPEPASPWRRRVVHYLLVFVTVVLVVDALVGDRGLLERLRARQQYDTVSQAIKVLREENAKLRSDIRRLRDDPAAVEFIAREELGLIKPGEVLFIIRDVKPASH